MTERRVKVNFGGEDLEGWDVPIEESTERWTELRLEDGAVLRTKIVATGVVRIDSKKDADGNPLYLLKSTNALTVAAGPTKLGTKKVIQ